MSSTRLDPKFEYFQRQLEILGVERKKNLYEGRPGVYDCQPDFGFRHRDFKIQFRNADELEKALGRQFKNRLTQLAGLVGYFGSFCRNYAGTEQTGVRQGAVASLAPAGETEEEAVAGLEDLFGPRSDNPGMSASTSDIKTKSPVLGGPVPGTPGVPPIVTKVAGTVDFEARPSVVPVPQTSKSLLGIYKTRRAVQQAVQYAKECGLMQCVDDSFSAKRHFSKKYAWNKVCEHQLRELMKKHGILIPALNGRADVKPFRRPKASRRDDVSQLYYKVRLGKGMRTPGLTERGVCQILSWKHRHVLEPFLDRLERVNEGRPDCEKLVFRFSVRFANGFNIRNGCRAYSLAGGLVKESKRTDPSEESFEEYFRRTRNDDPAEYDVKGSVPRINRLVNSGVWDDWDVDPYSEMFPGFCVDSERREIAKDTYMLYEFEQSGRKIAASLARSCPEFVKSEGKEEIRQTLEYWYEGVWKWQGDSLGSLAFLYEDAAYGVVDFNLKKLGYDFIRKYDCWVFPKSRRPAEKEFRELVRKCVTWWYRTEYAKERAELAFLESAGVREYKRHLFEQSAPDV